MATFTLKHIVIGLLVREAANVADGRRQQTHVSLLETSSSSFTSGSRLAVNEIDRRRNRGKAAQSVRVRDWSSCGRSLRSNQSLQSIGCSVHRASLYERTCRPSIRPTPRKRFTADHFHSTQKGRSRYRSRTTCQRWRLSDSRYVFADKGTRNPVFQRLDQAAVRIHVRIAAFRFDRILLIVAIYKPIERTTRTTKSKIHTSAVTGTVFFGYLELDETEHE